MVFVAHSTAASSAHSEGGARAAEPAQLLLGRVRLALADWLEHAGELQRPPTPHMLWVYDFPLFEKEAAANEVSSADGQHARPRWSAMHHPFSAPVQEDEAKVLASKELETVTGQCYDLVCNGARCHFDPCSLYRVLHHLLGSPRFQSSAAYHCWYGWTGGVGNVELSFVKASRFVQALKLAGAQCEYTIRLHNTTC